MTLPTVTARAPGKIILFGEHAVVYARPALAAPLTMVEATVTVRPAGEQEGCRIEAPDVDISARLEDLPADDPLAAALQGTCAALGRTPPPLVVHIHSTIPLSAGMGSGTAVSVAIARAVSAYLEQPLTAEQVSGVAYEVERLHHGTPSGIDNTVITYGKPVYFVRGKPIATFQPGAALTLVIADSGIRTPTRVPVGDVRCLWQADPPRWEAVFDHIGALTEAAYAALRRGDIPALGPLMDENHALLRELTVSCPELERLTAAARQAGALGAKLSGGGRGGACIALVAPPAAEAVAAACREAGARRTLTTTLS